MLIKKQPVMASMPVGYKYHNTSARLNVMWPTVMSH